jgi:hypothetical protein
MDNEENTLAQFIAHVNEVLKAQVSVLVKMTVLDTFAQKKIYLKGL